MKNKVQLLSMALGLALALPVQASPQRFTGGGGGGGFQGASGSHSAPSRSAPGRGGFNRAGFNRAGFARAGSMTGPRFTNGRFNSGGAHIVARQAASAHPNWSRNHDHFWHGHRCRFVNGSWFLFDFGFYDPFFYGYPYGYPYAYGYPYGYPYGGYDGYNEPDDNGVYQGRDPGYQGSDVRSYNNESPVAIAQARLKRLGYYHGSIDGKIGPATERAIAAYQRDHGQRVTGAVTRGTLNSIQGQE